MKRRQFDKGLRGKEIFEIHPVILGGDPVDPSNKLALGREEHIQLVNYWNRLIRDLRTAQSSSRAAT